MEQLDHYDALSKYYDEMVGKNRDYGEIAQTISTLIGDRKTVLEIGMGTGLVIDNLLEINPDYEVWGIDNSESLLEQAKLKLGHRSQVHLYLEDVLNFDLGQHFEAIYSRGGAMFFIEQDGEYFLASHLDNRDNNYQALACIANHLQQSGVFILNTGQYKTYRRELDNGITHERRVDIKTENGQQYLVMDYSFTRNDVMLDNKVLRIFLMKYDDAQDVFSEAGLGFCEISTTSQYHIYRKEA